MSIKLNPDDFYRLESKPQDSTWITVGNISVYIKHEDEGVVVDLYARGVEDRHSLASTYAFFNEAKELQDEVDEELLGLTSKS